MKFQTMWPSLCKGNTCHNGQQAIGGHDQQGCCDIVTAATVHHAVYTSVQCAYSIQIWFQYVCSRLAIVPQLCRKPRPRNIRHECKHLQHQHISRHPCMHMCRRHKSSNRERC